MIKSGPEAFSRRFPYIILSIASVLLLAALFVFAAPPETSGDHADPVKPLPQDSGFTGLKEMLRRLNTTARLMQTTAHPDDEDGGMLTLESRGKGVSTLLLTLTRGEGGQNKVGSNLFDVLGFCGRSNFWPQIAITEWSRDSAAWRTSASRRVRTRRSKSGMAMMSRLGIWCE